MFEFPEPYSKFLLPIYFIYCNVSFHVSSYLFHSPLSASSRGSLVPFLFLPLEWYHLHIWGWYFSQQSWFQLVIHPAWQFAWCTLIRSKISRVTIYSLVVPFSNFGPVFLHQISWFDFTEFSEIQENYIYIHILMYTYVHAHVWVVLFFVCFFLNRWGRKICLRKRVYKARFVKLRMETPIKYSPILKEMKSCSSG